jgi:glycosyltransferase involved in cell wall biosynthesis
MIVGGAQENTLLSVEGLDRYPEYDVTLISGRDDGPEGSLLPRVEKTTKLIVIPELQRNLKPLNDIKAFVKLYRALRKGRYHIVHTHSTKAGVLGRIAAALAGTPIVVHTLHSLVFHDFQPWLLNRALRLVKKMMAPLTHHFISVSDIVRQNAIAAGIDDAEKFCTIYSGMELDWFLNAAGDPAKVREEFGIPLDAPVVGKVARLFNMKGHDQLFDAAPEIVKRNPHVRFLLIGDGILQEHLQRRADAMGIRENFVFAGLIPRERIPQMIAAMDVVVHTSLREGLARVLPQGLAMGKPCVSYDLDGAPEVVIPGRTGFLVKPGDKEGLADAICTLVGDSDLRNRLGEEGRRIVDPAFRAETMVSQISDVYQHLLVKHRRRVEQFDVATESEAGELQ